MDFKEIQELIKLINKSNLTEFKMKDGDFQLSIRTKKFGKVKSQKIMQTQPQMVPVQTPAIPPVQPAAYTPAPAPAPAASGSDTPPSDSQSNGESAESISDNLIPVKSPIVGTFYRSPSPEKPPYFNVGDNIKVGDVVCIVEAMKLFNEIESEVSGKIVKVVTEDASPVEYDQVLFLVDPKG